MKISSKGDRAHPRNTPVLLGIQRSCQDPLSCAVTIKTSPEVSDVESWDTPVIISPLDLEFR
jgi:hypothetical protein